MTTQIEEAIKAELEREDKKQAEAKKQAVKNKQDQLKKEAAAKALLPKPKYYYDVKVECMLPATLTYRILAEGPQQAAEMIKNMSPTSVKHRLIGKKDIKLMVYDSGSTMLKWVRNLLGG